MPEDLKLSQIGSSPLPSPFRGLHSPGVRKHCQIIFACYFRKSSIVEELASSTRQVSHRERMSCHCKHFLPLCRPSRPVSLNPHTALLAIPVSLTDSTLNELSAWELEKASAYVSNTSSHLHRVTASHRNSLDPASSTEQRGELLRHIRHVWALLVT